MTNIDTFPLLTLPYLPLANVIRQIDSIHERVHFATLSRRTAILVKSLRDIKVLGLILTVSSDLTLKMVSSGNNRIIEQEWTFLRNLYKLEFLSLVDYNRLKKFIDTMIFIFSLSGVELVVRWEEDATMKMSRLQNRLWNVNTIKFERTYSRESYNQVLAAFPSVRNVSLTAEPNKQLMTKRLDILELDSRSMYGLGTVNCESLQIKTSHLIGKELNQFMKKWIQGRMPRLKHARIRYLLAMHQDLIFEGIENEEADQNREMTFKSYSLNLGDPQTTVVQGGLDIKSESSARATVTFKIRNRQEIFSSWNMNVWD